MQPTRPLLRSRSPFIAALLALSLTATAAWAERPAGEVLSHKAGVPWPAVIAHRGLSFNAPEETLPAFIAARDLGADYLEMDLQRTKDGVLIALHDDKLTRTTNVGQVFPERAEQPVNTFTLAELKQLDAGSWFNQAFPEQARPGFAGLKILTLDEVIDIAEGGANKPGLYLETKVPAQFPGIEKDLQALLQKRGWLWAVSAPDGFDATQHNGTGYSAGRVVLQTFDKASLTLLNQAMPQAPKILLLWLGDGAIEVKDATSYASSGAKDKAEYYGMLEVKDRATYAQWLDFAKANGATGVGPATKLKNGGEFSYMDMTQPWMNQMAHEKGLFIHPYTVNDAVDFKAVAGVDGFFTNRADQLLAFYHRAAKQSADEVLTQAGYPKP